MVLYSMIKARPFCSVQSAFTWITHGLDDLSDLGKSMCTPERRKSVMSKFHSSVSSRSTKTGHGEFSVLFLCVLDGASKM